MPHHNLRWPPRPKRHLDVPPRPDGVTKMGWPRRSGTCPTRSGWLDWIFHHRTTMWGWQRNCSSTHARCGRGKCHCKEDDMWSLWSFRNDLQHGKEHIPIQKVLEWVVDTTTHLLHIWRSTTEANRQHSEHAWCPPVIGFIKINTNASFSTANYHVAVPTVMPDSYEVFMRDLVNWLLIVQSLWSLKLILTY
jgi:hypothetical protein